MRDKLCVIVLIDPYVCHKTAKARKKPGPLLFYVLKN